MEVLWFETIVQLISYKVNKLNLLRHILFGEQDKL